MSPKYKLSYFNLTALGEPIRILFHYGGIHFEDNRFERAEWPFLKPNMPFGQAPTLEIDQKVINQSNAIARYVARLVNLDGSDAFEDLEIDAMVDNINDLRLKIAQYWYETDEELKKKIFDTLLNETLPYILSRLDAIAKINKGHFVSEKLTWADIFFVGLLDYLNHMLGFDLTEKYPNLAAVRSNVTSVPTIKQYLDSRPKTEF